MVRKILSFLGCFLLIGCGNRDTDSLARLFPEKIDLQSEPCKIRSDDILNPLYLTFMGDYLICANFRTEKCIRIYDWISGEPINDIINIGRGPDELLNISSMHYSDGRLIVYSNNASRVLTIPYDELQNVHPKMTILDSISKCFRVLPVAYDQFIQEGCMDMNYFTLADGSGRVYSSFDAYPGNEERNNPGGNRLIHQGQLMASPDGKHFVFAASAGIIFKFCEVAGKGSVKKTKEYAIAPPKYTLNSDPARNSHSIRWEESCPAGTLSVAAGSRYCFFLQDENKSKLDPNWRASTVLVFDWKGKPIIKLHLDKPLESITYNERENTLIGLTLNEQGQPLFVSYLLSDIFSDAPSN